MPKTKKPKGSPESGVRGGNSHKMKDLRSPFHPKRKRKVSG